MASKKLIYALLAIVAALLVTGGLFILLKGEGRREGSVTTPSVSTSPPPATSSSTLAPSQVQTEGFSKEITYTSAGLGLKGYLCKPAGSGPFPAVMFNHGGSGSQIGGDPEGTCKALSAAGFVGLSPIRTTDKSMDKNLQNAQDAFTYLKELDYVDTKRIGMIGFSRGVLITYDTAVKNPSDFSGLVLMAGGLPSEYADGYSKAGNIQAPVLLLVADNDTPAKINGNQNMVNVVTSMKTNLENAGVSVEMKIYPPYSEGHGHTMFFEVGDYWKDVVGFLNKNLQK